MNALDRITFDPAVMGGKPCLRGLRVTAGMIVGLVASGHSHANILRLYPYLEEEDITQALSCSRKRRTGLHRRTPRPRPIASVAL